MKARNTRLQPMALRKMSPSRPDMPTAAAAIARFCGEIILPRTPPEELAAAISAGCSPASFAAVTCRAPNSELDEVAAFLEKAPGALRLGGRLVTIAFHEGEDRLVKFKFRELALKGGYRLPSRKSIKSSQEEVAVNPRARSAQLRILERVS